MGIEQIELREDRVRIHYHLRTCDFNPDIDSTIEILYRDIGRLPPAPVRRRDAAYELPLPTISRTILLYFPEHQERSAGANVMDESIDGPYLKATPRMNAFLEELSDFIDEANHRSDKTNYDQDIPRRDCRSISPHALLDLIRLTEQKGHDEAYEGTSESTSHYLSPESARAIITAFRDKGVAEVAADCMRVSETWRWNHAHGSPDDEANAYISKGRLTGMISYGESGLVFERLRYVPQGEQVHLKEYTPIPQSAIDDAVLRLQETDAPAGQRPTEVG